MPRKLLPLSIQHVAPELSYQLSEDSDESSHQHRDMSRGSLIVSDIDNAQCNLGHLLLPAFPCPSLKTEIKPTHSECPILSLSRARKYQFIADGCRGKGTIISQPIIQALLTGPCPLGTLMGQRMEMGHKLDQLYSTAMPWA